MSWFSVLRRRRRHADERGEIVERCSLPRIGLAVLGLLAVGGGTAAFMMTQAPVGTKASVGAETPPEFNRHPELTQAIVAKIVATQDRGAVYRMLGRYEILDSFARGQFWRLVGAFKMTDLRPFAEVALRVEVNPRIRNGIEVFLRLP